MNVLVFISASIAVVVAIIALPSFDFKWRRPKSSSTVADLVVTNAIIYTSDASLPFAEAMAIRNGRILRVGNYSSIQDLLGHETRELNLTGKIVLPGFIDSHVHLISGGLQMVRVDLRGVNSKDEFVRLLKEAVKDKEHGCWVLGGGWNNELWGGDLPVASWIDDITRDNPVWLSRMDGHMGLANSLALTIAGISIDTEDPHGGTIMRTTGGEPTGLLIDSAMNLLFPWIPVVSVDERRDALLRASKYALTRGVTTIVDFGRYFPGASVEPVWEDFSDVYQWADSVGKMLIRVCLFFPMETWSRLHVLLLSNFIFQDLHHKMGQVLSQWIYLGGVKAFADGSLGSNSALFYELSSNLLAQNPERKFKKLPYADEPQNYGLVVIELDNLFNMTVASDKSELQVAIHAIGDRANDLILDMYNSVVSSDQMRDRRFRIEHAQHLTPGAATRYGQLGIIASVQPEHLLDDADSAAKKLGMDRAQTGSYLFKSLLASNALLAFGSDWPVADINPLGGIATAIKRIPTGWKNSWIPSECLTLDDALKAYTISAAHACFLDQDLGSLSPGKLADFVILSSTSWDDFEVEASASVEATFVGGIQAYP